MNTPAKTEAIEMANAHTNNVGLPTYTELAAALADLLCHCANRGINTGSVLDHITVKDARGMLNLIKPA